MKSFEMPEKSKKRWEAFWKCEVLDRPALLAVARQRESDPVRPLPDGSPPRIPLPPPPRNRDEYDYWFDIDNMIERNLRHAAEYAYTCEASPMLDTRWSVAYCLPFGVKCGYNEHAAWCEPLGDVGCANGFAYDYGGLWHKWLIDGTKRMAEAGRGLYYLSPVMWGNHSGDTLSNLVGLGRLMTDCADRPGDVRRALETITDAQIAVFSEITEIAKATGLEGTRNYTGIWSPEAALSFDCDVSAMVSPRTFTDIFLPPLERIMETVSHRIYHLDGPCCLQHLDALLGLPQLQAIQWVPGAGRENLDDWYWLYEKIQAAGKSIIVYANCGQALDVCRRLKPEGLAISVRSESEGEMAETVEKVEAFYR